MSKIQLIDKHLLDAEQIDDRYGDSPFLPLKFMTPKQKGRRYEMITECILKRLGYTIDKPKSSDYDRSIDGERCEIKGSMLNKNSDNFSFLQIRPDQDYDKIVFSMMYPDDVVIMQMTKDDVLENIKKGIFKKQHGGNKANSRTFMYYGNKDTLSKIGAVELT
jgi:hypothetical protein